MRLETFLERGDIPSEVKEAIENELAERKRLEDALRESEERCLQITRMVTDYIYTVRIENGYPVETVHAPACEIVTGYTLEEFNFDPFLWIRMVPQEDWDVVRKQASRILSGHDPQQIEHRILRKDGIIRRVRNTPVLHYDIQGNLISYEGLIRDITERKRSEEALRESEERLRSFMDSATDSFSIWDSELNLVDINTVGMEMFQTGTKRADIMGKSMLDLVPDTKETGRYNRYMEVLITGEPFFEEALVPHPKFGDIHLAVKAFKVGDGLGAIATLSLKTCLPHYSSGVCSHKKSTPHQETRGLGPCNLS